MLENTAVSQPERILTAPPAGLTEAQLVALARAEERRAAEAQEAPELTFDPREDAARIVETLKFEGCDEVATAIRGDMDPQKGIETLTAALYDGRIPSQLKGSKKDPRAVREALAAAKAARDAEWTQRKDALAAQPAEALEAFAEFREELREVSRRLPGYATDQRIRSASARFFRVEEGLPPLVKTLEVLIVAKEGNEVNFLLRTDPQLAGVVAAAPEGRQAAPLLAALQARAREAVQDNGRRRNGGAFGRNDGQTPASHEARDAARQSARLARDPHRTVGKKGKKGK